MSGQYGPRTGVYTVGSMIGLIGSRARYEPVDIVTNCRWIKSPLRRR